MSADFESAILRHGGQGPVVGDLRNDFGQRFGRRRLHLDQRVAGSVRAWPIAICLMRNVPPRLVIRSSTLGRIRLSMMWPRISTSSTNAGVATTAGLVSIFICAPRLRSSTVAGDRRRRLARRGAGAGMGRFALWIASAPILVRTRSPGYRDRPGESGPNAAVFEPNSMRRRHFTTRHHAPILTVDHALHQPQRRSSTHPSTPYTFTGMTDKPEPSHWAELAKELGAEVQSPTAPPKPAAATAPPQRRTSEAPRAAATGGRLVAAGG